MENHTVWDSLVEQMSQNFHCHLIALPGHGFSNDESSDFTFSTLCEQIENYAEEFEHISIIAHSMGAYLVGELLQRNQLQFDKILLSQASIVKDSKARLKQRQKLKHLLERYFDKLPFFIFQKYEQANDLITQASKMNPQVLIHWQNLLLQRSCYQSVFENNYQRILFIRGGEDQEMNYELPEYFQFIDLEELNHLIPEKEQFPRYYELVSDYFEG
jgi:pimeloyl-ACP methyl ester carboxylesterase